MSDTKPKTEEMMAASSETKRDGDVNSEAKGLSSASDDAAARTLLRLEVPVDTPKMAFDPFPGSKRALTYGCICPSKQSSWPNMLFVVAECPVHQAEHVVRDDTAWDERRLGHDERFVKLAPKAAQDALNAAIASLAGKKAASSE